VAGTQSAIVRTFSVTFVNVMPPSGLVPVLPLVTVASATGAGACDVLLDVLDLVACHRDMGDEVA
jgi:hypothetical protein